MLLQMGFYCGLAMFYPYPAVYCSVDSCLEDCRSVFHYQSMSAPLPTYEDKCRIADASGVTEWLPRIVPEKRQQALGYTRICFIQDK